MFLLMPVLASNSKMHAKMKWDYLDILNDFICLVRIASEHSI